MKKFKFKFILLCLFVFACDAEMVEINTKKSALTYSYKGCSRAGTTNCASRTGAVCTKFYRVEKLLTGNWQFLPIDTVKDCSSNACVVQNIEYSSLKDFTLLEKLKFEEYATNGKGAIVESGLVLNNTKMIIYTAFIKENWPVPNQGEKFWITNDTDLNAGTSNPINTGLLNFLNVKNGKTFFENDVGLNYTGWSLEREQEFLNDLTQKTFLTSGYLNSNQHKLEIVEVFSPVQCAKE